MKHFDTIMILACALVISAFSLVAGMVIGVDSFADYDYHIDLKQEGDSLWVYIMDEEGTMYKIEYYKLEEWLMEDNL